MANDGRSEKDRVERLVENELNPPSKRGVKHVMSLERAAGFAIADLKIAGKEITNEAVMARAKEIVKKQNK